MYCFSSICRICLTPNKTDLIKLNNSDIDNIKINDKLIYCIPEIFSPYNNLPENICEECYQFIQRMYKFKQTCIDNTITLNKYAVKLSEVPGVFNKNKLIIQIETDINIENLYRNSSEENYNQNTIKQAKNFVSQSSILINKDHPKSKSATFHLNSSNSLSVSPEGIPMYSVSLNKWDLFETKYTCRCIKEFSSFTENTEHLCKNCEGELLGFRLSKIKLGAAENRYNTSLSKVKCENEDSDSIKSEISDVESGDDSIRYERGFDYNDVLLCKVHINGVNKQINRLENNIYLNYDCNTESDDRRRKKITNSRNNTRYSCTKCRKTFSRRYYLNKHFLSHTGSKLHECDKCGKRYINEDDFNKHKLVHYKASRNKHEHHSNFISRRRRKSLSKNIKRESVSPTSCSTPKFSTTNEFKSPLFHDKSDSEEVPHNLSQSSKNSDSNSSGEVLVCGTCDKVLSSKGKLAIHLMTHFGKKEYKCSVCHKEFFRKENFDLHFKTHQMEILSLPDDQGLNKYKCPYCDKMYNHHTNVRRHIKENHSLEKYSCSICKKTFVEEHALEQHIANAHTQTENTVFSEEDEGSTPQLSVKKYKCPHCDKRYNHVTNVRRHMKDNHNVDKFTCSICKKTFVEKRTLEQHISDAHTQNTENTVVSDDDDDSLPTQQSVKKYKCPNCDRRYNYVTNMRKHMKEIHNIEKYSCSICKEAFDGKLILEQHISDEHMETENTGEGDGDDSQTKTNVKKYKCPYCDKRYNHVTNVRRHMRERHSVDQYSCSICYQLFNGKHTLEQHVSDAHIETENVAYSTDEDTAQQNVKKYKCPICDKSYINVANVRRHMRDNHNEEDAYLCSICNNIFNDKHLLKQHISDVHTQTENGADDDKHVQENEKKYKCTSCDKSYNHITNVRRHMRESHNVDKYLCSICNETFVEKRTLEQHIFDAHTQTENINSADEAEEKTYSCPVCEKNFNHLSNLRMHALSHAEVSEIPDEYNFCNICKKKYSKNTSMSRHMMTHVSGNVYNCTACAAKFDNRWVMRQHMKSAHPNFIPIFQCKDCLKTYTTNFSLQKHRRIHTK